MKVFLAHSVVAFAGGLSWRRELRQSAAALVYYEMLLDDPASARSWVSTLRNVDADWQARNLGNP